MENEKKNGQLSQEELGAVSGGSPEECSEPIEFLNGIYICPHCGCGMQTIGETPSGRAYQCKVCHLAMYRTTDNKWYISWDTVK